MRISAGFLLVSTQRITNSRQIADNLDRARVEGVGGFPGRSYLALLHKIQTAGKVKRGQEERRAEEATGGRASRGDRRGVRI